MRLAATCLALTFLGFLSAPGMGQDQKKYLILGDGDSTELFSICEGFNQSNDNAHCEAIGIPDDRIRFMGDDLLDPTLSGLVLPATTDQYLLDILKTVRKGGVKVVTYDGAVPKGAEDARDAEVSSMRAMGIEMALLLKLAQPDGGKACILSNNPPGLLSPWQLGIMQGLEEAFGGQDGGGLTAPSDGADWTSDPTCLQSKTAMEGLDFAKDSLSINAIIALSGNIDIDGSNLVNRANAPISFVGLGEHSSQIGLLATGKSAGQVAWPDQTAEIANALQIVQALATGQSFDPALAETKPKCNTPCASNGCDEVFTEPECPKPVCSSSGCEVAP